MRASADVDATTVATGAFRPGRWTRFRDLVGRAEVVAGLVILTVLGALAIAAPLLAPYLPTEIDLTGAGAPPSARHWHCSC